MVHKQTVGSQAESASAQPLPARAKRSTWRRMWWNRSLYLLLAPVLAGMTLFQYYPALIAFYRSFFAWDGLRAHFIGLENFRFFFEDRRMATAWTNTSIILIFSTAVVLTMPLLTAYLIYSLRNDRHRYFFRVIFVLPLIVPSFVQIVLWRWVLSGNGAINMLLRTIGLGAITRPWLGDPDTALGASLFTGFPWIGGVTMLIYPKSTHSNQRRARLRDDRAGAAHVRRGHAAAVGLRLGDRPGALHGDRLPDLRWPAVYPRRRNVESRGGVMHRGSRFQILTFALLSLFSIFQLIPIVLMLSMSIKTTNQIQTNPLLPTLPLHFENYPRSWTIIQRYMLNSLGSTFLILIGNLCLSALAAYVLARYRFPGRTLIFSLILALLMVPGITILVPRYVLVRDLYLINSLWAIILPGIFGASAFNIFVLRTFFGTLPEELFESARLDGAGHLTILRAIVIPLSMPIISSLAILQVLGSWNDYVWPYLVLNFDSVRTLAVGIVGFADRNNQQLGLQMSASVIGSIPLLVLFLVAMRSFVAGLTSGALKL